MSQLTLREYYEAAKLPTIPIWAEQVKLPEKKKWFKHQADDLVHLAGMTRSGLFNDAGVGKTWPLQGYALWLVSQKNKVVVVMPPTLVPQFKQSLSSTFIGHEAFVTSEILQAPPKKREKLFEHWNSRGVKWPDILIMSYKMFVLYHKMLDEKGYTCVIVDEAQAVKTPGTQLHNAVKIFAGKFNRYSNGVVLATGTPIETNPTDAYGYFAICYPQRYGSYKNFENIHCEYSEAYTFLNDMGERVYVPRRILNYKNLDYLHDGLMKLGRRVKKEDVLDLPPRLITELTVKLSSAHKQLYKQLVDERLAEIGDKMIDLTTQSALYQATQRSIICPESYTDQTIQNEVLNTLDVLLSTLEGNKVIVYCWYTESVKKLAARYASMKPAVLYGQTTGREVQKQKFIHDSECKLLIANPKSGGVGVDGLQDVSSHIVFAEICPFVGVVQQAIARVHRSGQKSKTVNVYLLVPNGTIAVKLRNDLVRKDKLQEEIMKDKRTLLNDLMGAEGLQGALDDID